MHTYSMQGKVRGPYLSRLIEETSDALIEKTQFYIDLPTISTWILSVIFCVSQFTFFYLFSFFVLNSMRLFSFLQLELEILQFSICIIFKEEERVMINTSFLPHC